MSPKALTLRQYKREGTSVKNDLSEKQVREAIKTWLKRNGWGLNLEVKPTHAPGCDIQAQNNKSHSRYFFIEVKGGPWHEVSMVYALGQIVTRMKVIAKHAYLYGIGLPQSSAKKAVKRIPWQVLKRLCLYVFSVDLTGWVTRYSWKDAKTEQE